jgi:hypothetical protein
MDDDNFGCKKQILKNNTGAQQTFFSLEKFHE